MIRNYFTVAIRNLLKNKTFSIINIGGLAIGLAACWMITLYVSNELSYDNYHANAARIYRIAQHATWNGGKFDFAVTPPPYAAAFKNDYPEVQETVRFDAEGGGTIIYNKHRFEEGGMLFADSTVFKIFSYHFLYGDAATALSKPQTIVLTNTLATKIFGDASVAVGKVISFGNNNDNIVTGVIEDVPVNSHFSFAALRSMPKDIGESWDNSGLYTYVLLKENTDIKKLEAKLASFFDRHLKTSMGADVKYKAELQPLESIHLHSNLGYEIGPNGNIRYIYIFSLIAALILIIASINYMNLSTARASLRIKEIGVRKVNGSGRGQLILMFLAESVLITFIASLIAIILLNIAMPWFRQFTGKDINTWHFGIAKTCLLLTGFSLFAGCLSGIYPALFLSGFKLIPALKNQTVNRRGTLLFRQSLVVFQFVITITMIAGSAIIYQQLQYVLKKDLGFNKDQVITFHISRNMRKQIPAIKEELLKNPLVEAVAAASNPIGNNNIGGRDYIIPSEGNTAEKGNMAKQFFIDEDFIPTLEAHLVAGRNFSQSMPADKYNAVIINETLAKDAGWKDPVGKKIQLGKDSAGNPALFEVAGVVKDFNIYSLQHKIEPLILQLPMYINDKDNLYVRLNKKNVKAALAFTGDVYKKFDAENPFEFSFLDENFAQQYKAEQMQGNLLVIFTVLAITIACLGLFGLVTFTAEQRKKEIGIRKVLGSSVTGVVVLLGKDLIKLVLIAVVIATPIAWLAMSKWLQDFEYRMNINWLVFAFAGIIALLIAVVTVSVKAIKAAVANPVKSLRTE